MALARSASGPPALSININSANSPFGASTKSTQQQPASSGGFFGQSPLSQPSGSMFGAVKPAATGGGLFGPTTTTTQSAPGGLFGTAQPATGGGFFGSAVPAAAKPATGFFGAPATTQPATGGGLFGSTAQTQQPSTGGLFGSAMAQPQQQASGGLFGSNNQTQAKPSLFGGATTQQSQPQEQNSLFGGAQQQQGAFSTTLGGLTMGQSNAPVQTVPAVRIDPSNIKGTTRYNDLNEQIQKEIENQDKMMLDVMKASSDCGAMLPAHGAELEVVPDQFEFLQRKMIGVQANIDSDIQMCAQLNKQVHVDAENAKLSFEAIHSLKLPQQFQQGMWNAAKQTSPSTRKPGEPAGDIVNLFDQTAEEMSQTYKNQMAKLTEIENHLYSLERSLMRAGTTMGGGSQEENDVQLVGEALRDFENGMIQVANQVARAREDVRKIESGPFIDVRATHSKTPRRGVY